MKNGSTKILLFSAVCLLLLISSCYHGRQGRVRSGDRQDLGLIIPVAGVVSLDHISPFGADRQHGRRRHNGIDIFAEAGTPVLAPQNGRIVHIAHGKSAGNYIYLLDYRGEFLYGFLHLQDFARGLHKNQKVRQGQVIGYVGSSGNASATSPHLHFSIARLFTPGKAFDKKRYVDPMLFFRN